ncbi:hypothetical protein WDW86_00910 [Bdellovibrionota bacterium FG-2]
MAKQKRSNYRHRAIKKSLTSAALATGIILFALKSTDAKADFFLHHWENQRETADSFRLSADFSYYSTHADYDAAGTQLLPAGLTNYSRINSDVSARYGFTDRVSAYGRMSWARIELQHATRPGSSFGFTDQSLGTTIKVFQKGRGSTLEPRFDLQFQVDVPLYNNTVSETNLLPYLGDGSVDFTAGAFMVLPLWQKKGKEITSTLGGAYTYRSANFSAAIPWSWTLRYNTPTQGFFTAAGFNGLQSLKTDPNALHVSGTSGSIGSGGSFITNAVNPSLLTVFAQAGFRLSPKLAVTIAGDQSLWGQASPVGLNLLVGLQARLGGPDPKDPSYLAPKDYGKSNQGFVNYTLTAKVIRSNDRMNLLKIDKGSSEGVEVGQTFDIFKVKTDGSVDEAVARARVTHVRADESALSVDEYFKEVWIDEGFIAKRPIP